MTSSDKPFCPAALNIAGEHYPCQQMEQMAPGSENHDGWAHSNRDADAIWASDRDPVPGMPAYDGPGEALAKEDAK